MAFTDKDRATLTRVLTIVEGHVKDIEDHEGRLRDIESKRLPDKATNGLVSLVVGCATAWFVK